VDTTGPSHVGGLLFPWLWNPPFDIRLPVEQSLLVHHDVLRLQFDHPHKRCTTGGFHHSDGVFKKYFK
jgi:hypothetical protein